MDVDGFTPTQITQKAEKVQFQIQQASFERDFLITPLTGCDMILGNPWLEFHMPILDSKKATFFITEGVPQPCTIVCDKRLPGFPLISHLQARRALRKGAECALLYIRVRPQQSSSHSILQVESGSDPPPAAEPVREPRMQALVDKYSHLMLRDGLPPKLPPSRPEDHHIDLAQNHPVSSLIACLKLWKVNWRHSYPIFSGPVSSVPHLLHSQHPSYSS